MSDQEASVRAHGAALNIGAILLGIALAFAFTLYAAMQDRKVEIADLTARVRKLEAR